MAGTEIDTNEVLTLEGREWIPRDKYREVRAERERFRKALRQIAEDTDFGDTMNQIARETLGMPPRRG